MTILTGSAAMFREQYRALQYIMGGNAILIVKSLQTGTIFQYRIKQKSEDLWYVYKFEKYPATYLGAIRAYKKDKETSFTFFRSGLVDEHHQKMAEAFDWMFFKLVQTKLPMPEKIELYHTGYCSVCSRPLTDPESVLAGIGPTCRKRLGI